MRSIRVVLFRFLATVLVAAQSAGYALSPYAEARAGSPVDPTPHIEASHSATCVVVHSPDHCLACQLLSLRSRTPAPAVRSVPELAVIAIRPESQSGVHGAGVAASTSQQPRAPPVTSA